MEFHLLNLKNVNYYLFYPENIHFNSLCQDQHNIAPEDINELELKD